tara:strand:- start:137 stop:565 length:429 start_codon:yes stop_codon:yes gene_type:complete
MIKYKLICKHCNNLFDSWFASSKEYEKLKKLKYLNCHNCNSSSVEKTLMSPNVLRSSIKTKKKDENKKQDKIKKIINQYQNFIKKNFEYVGDNFEFEARSMHYENKKNSKGIYGSATKKQIEELSEEGIETEIIPWIKDTTN